MDLVVWLFCQLLFPMSRMNFQSLSQHGREVRKEKMKFEHVQFHDNWGNSICRGRSLLNALCGGIILSTYFLVFVHNKWWLSDNFILLKRLLNHVHLSNYTERTHHHLVRTRAADGECSHHVCCCNCPMPLIIFHAQSSCTHYPITSQSWSHAVCILALVCPWWSHMGRGHRWGDPGPLCGMARGLLVQTSRLLPLLRALSGRKPNSQGLNVDPTR